MSFHKHLSNNMTALLDSKDDLRNMQLEKEKEVQNRCCEQRQTRNIVLINHTHFCGRGKNIE